MNLSKDIYYSKAYTNLYVDARSVLFDFEYRESEKIFLNVAIKRPIAVIGEKRIGEIGFDLETPYGYGGYYTNCLDREFVLRAMAEYTKRCQQEGIIAEFIRFHPFNPFPEQYGDLFDFCVKDRRTVYVNLNQPYEEIWAHYTNSLRRNINKAMSNRLSFLEFEKNNDIISTFIELYYATMRKHHAYKMYFFTREYFEKLFQLKSVKLFGILVENLIINQVLILESPPAVYYHLGATNQAYYHYNPNPLVFDALMRIYHEKGYQIFFMGGGKTSDPNDSLFKFKKKFSDTTKNFYIAGKIFNPEKYQQCMACWEQQQQGENIQYFLKYRL